MQNTAPTQQADPVQQNTSLPNNRSEETISQLAHELNKCVPRRTNFYIPTRLKQFTDFFQECFDYFDETNKAQVSTSQTAEWLLDNFYIIEQAVRQVEEDLPADYYQRLPKTQAGWPRIYLIALSNTHGENIRLDIEQIKNFLQVFQKVTPLTTGELWALPLMLRLAVLESLAEALAAATQLKWDSMSQTVLQRRTETPDQVDPNEIVANSILDLRLLATQDWKAFFESTSLLEQILRGDPAGLYAQMYFETRNHYRSVIEELAHGSTMSEADIATQTVQLAQAGVSTREKHVGYYFLASGREVLETRINFHSKFSVRLIRFIQKNATTSYLGSIAALTFLFVLLAGYYAMQAGGSTLQLILAGILTILPATSVSIDIINGLVVAIIPPRTLPKLNFDNGVPEEYKTMVVIPALLATERDAPLLLSQIERHFIGNSDPNIFFALITDFADAPEKEIPADDQPIAQTKAAIEQLNKKYGNQGYHPFYFFHRERKWNESEECWMGWERKRGKLEEFNKLLSGSDSTTFTVKFGDLSILPTIRYVITLDADTVLPRESARQLIGTLAHPLNQAEFDPTSGEIKAGHTILQPRVQVRPAAANQSLFTRVYSGDSVIDLYTRAVSDAYQDLFDEGNYVGKGIYDVRAFQKSLQNKIPENRLLSHDLFEGMQGRCGLVTDVVLYEDYPPHYLIYTDRLHRWIRGDWQLLPWLRTEVPHRTEGKAPNTLSSIDRWKLFDNLRRSLVPPTILAFLISGWLLLPGYGLIWMIFALSPYLMAIVSNFIAELHHSFSKQHSTVVTRPLRLATLRSLFEIIFLPHESYIIFDAITTTLTRLFITHKRLLQWVSAAHTVQLFGKRLHLKSAWQAMIIAPLLAFLFSILLLVLYPKTILSALPLLIGWMAAPYIATRISQPTKKSESKIIPAQQHKLRLLARSTWLYFEHFVGPEDRWLPPDHFQESPRGLVAHRTSPTNIGLTLLSTMAAHDMGYMGAPELSLRIRDTFDSMDSLERMRGHFLNWYDTRTSAPLLPRYVSTVDSGNLAACLLTLKQGCLEMGRRPVVYWQGFIDTLNMLSSVLEESNLGPSAEKLKGALQSINALGEQLHNPETFSPKLLAQLFDDAQAEFETMLWDAMQASGEEVSTESLRKLSTWVQRVRYQLRHMRTDLQVLAPWLFSLAEAPTFSETTSAKAEIANAWNELLAVLSLRPTLGEIPQICERATACLEQIMQLLEAA